MIKRAAKEDATVLASLAIQIWADNDPEGLTDSFRELIGNADAVCFLKYIGKKAIGFAQCQLRHDYVEGTGTSPVGYLEGIFVLPEYRGRGYGAALLSCCERWARAQGCTEFASDCELSNDDSLRFHLAAGFEEANRIICFRKRL